MYQIGLKINNPMLIGTESIAAVRADNCCGDKLRVESIIFKCEMQDKQDNGQQTTDHSKFVKF
jgi:hypothetical protein